MFYVDMYASLVWSMDFISLELKTNCDQNFTNNPKIAQLQSYKPTHIVPRKRIGIWESKGYNFVFNGESRFVHSEHQNKNI